MAARNILQLPMEQFRVYAQNHINDKYLIPLLLSVIGYALSFWVDWVSLSIWIVIVLITLVPTIRVYQKILSAQGEPDERKIQNWKIALAITRIPYLLAWSSLMLWAWVPGNENNHLFLIIFNTGLIGATGVMAYTLRGMMIWEVIVCFIPPFIRYAIEGEVYFAVAITSPFFFAVMLSLGTEMHKSFIKMVNMQLEKQDLIDKLETQAREDSLTHVHNRRSFMEHLSKAQDYSRHNNVNIGIAVIDADYFKKINDNYGHAAGDEVLVTIANILGENIRESDTLGRLGGEEFAILFISVDEQILVELVQRLIDKISSRKIETHKGVIQTSISAGIAMWDRNESMESLLNRADAAMYNAKNAGRNQLDTSKFTMLVQI